MGSSAWRKSCGRYCGAVALSGTLVAAGFVLAVAAGCGDPVEKLYRKYHEQVSSVGDINDDMVRKYARTIRLLRAEGVNFQQSLADDPRGQKEGFARIERAIQKGGFKDYPEFVRVNAKIAWAWNLAQARIGMEQQKNLNKWAQGATDEGIRKIDETLADPEVPESAKVELRKTREQLVKQKGVIAENWQKNKRWADWAMNFTIPLTNEKDIAVVIRNKDELMEAFTGLSKAQLEAIQEHSLKQLQLD